MSLRYDPIALIEDDVLAEGVVDLNGADVHWTLLKTTATTSHQREIHVDDANGVMYYGALATIRRYGDLWRIEGLRRRPAPTFTSLEQAIENIPTVLRPLFR